MMTLTIGPACAGDVRELAGLAGRTFPLACPPELDRDAVRAFIGEHLDESAFRDYLMSPATTVLLARSDAGDAVAYALLVEGTVMDEGCSGVLRGRHPLGISKFYLDSALHGSGAAAELLEAVEATARLDGADSLWLATNVANSRARRFYRRRGFDERGHREFEVGGTLNDDVVYERMLAP